MIARDDDPNARPDGPDRSTRVSGRRIWHAVRPYVRTYRGALIVGGVLSLATGAAGLALPLVVRELIAALGDGRSVAPLLGLMTALIVANAAIGALGGYVLARVGESVVRDARRDLLTHLVWLRVSAVEATEPGDLMTRVTADTTLVRQVVTDSLLQAITGTLTLVATVVLMALVDGVLLVVTLGVLVAAAIVIGVVVPRINRASHAAQESVGMIGAALERVFGAYRTVKAAGAEKRETNRLFAAADAAWDAGVRSALWSSVAGNTAGLAIQGAFVAVLTVGGARVAAGATDIGTLIAFLLYVFYLMAPIQQLVTAVTQFQIGAAAVQRILEAEALPTEDGGPGASAGRPDAPAVVFDRVRFRYDDDLPDVHHDVTFTIPSGGMTAFVGPSGAGKTTVFSLLERFYQPTAGRVLVDGVDVADWDLAALRETIGYVEQDAPVLSGTLRENIVFARPDADDAAVDQVVTTARLDQLLARSPSGLDTLVGHRGVKLSGGERQRVAIARALLRRPRLLLLDEATSQLDAVNEAALRDTVRDIARSATVLMVAHRLSTVVLADRIVVLDGGRVRAIGSHRELIMSDALYAELAATQLLSGAD